MIYRLIEEIPALVALPPKPKRLVAFAMCAGLAIGAWAIMGAMLYIPWPVGWIEWVERIFYIGTSAFGLATLIHTDKLPGSEAEEVAIAEATLTDRGFTVELPK